MVGAKEDVGGRACSFLFQGHLVTLLVNLLIGIGNRPYLTVKAFCPGRRWGVPLSKTTYVATTEQTM